MQEVEEHKSPLSEVIHEYADVSTIHGIRYILNSGSHWLDRIVWLLAVLITSILAIFASASIYDSWKESPVLTTIGTSEKPIADLEFPAITICGSGNNLKDLVSMLPQLLHEEWNEFWSNESNKKSMEEMQSKGQNEVLTYFVKSQIAGWPDSLDLESFLRDMTTDYNALIKTEILWKMKDSEEDSRPILDILLNPERQEELENLMHVIEQEIQGQFSNMDFSTEKAQKIVLTLLWFTSQPCSNFLKYCTWKGLVVACHVIFKLIPTDVGFCCSFNHDFMPQMLRNSSFAETIESIEDNFYKYHPQSSSKSNLWSRSKITKNEIDLTPMKGKQNGLTVVIDLQSESVKPSTLNKDYNGVQATVTPKDEFPFMLADSILISPGQETHVAISPLVTDATDALKDLKPNQRKCYFDDEFYLSLFRNYSVNSCWMECLMNLTMKELGPCTPWNFPQADKNMRICTPYEQHQYLSIFRQIDMTKVVGSEACLPNCGGTDYEVTITSAPFRRCDSANLGLSTLCHLGEPIVPQMWGSLIQDLYDNNVPDYIEEQIQSPERKYPKDMTFDLKQDYNAYEQDIAVATFYFPKHVAKALVRAPKMTTFDYVSQVGGLLGLCLGCSLISLVELIYWFSIGYWNKKSLIKYRKSSTVSKVSSSSTS